MATDSDDDEWGPDTGVEDHPPRAKTSPGGHRDARGQTPSARAAFEKIKALDKKFDEHSKADKGALAGINAQLSDHNRSLTAIQVSTAGLHGSVNTMVEELRHNRELEKVEIQVEGTARVEKHKTDRERMSNQTKIWLAVISVMSAAVAGAITHLVG